MLPPMKEHVWQLLYLSEISVTTGQFDGNFIGHQTLPGHAGHVEYVIILSVASSSGNVTNDKYVRAEVGTPVSRCHAPNTRPPCTF